jgi:hypothetical protein
MLPCSKGFYLPRMGGRKHLDKPRNAPDVELDRGQTDTGEPHISVSDPRAGFDDAPPCITRNERGWQMVRGGNGTLYEFATAREVAEFFIPRVGHRFGCW